MEVTQGVRFDTLNLSPEIMKALEKRGIELSTPVQAGCIPPMMEWKDVVAKAPTGTGKTFAYGIPIVEHIDPEDESVQAVILAPTRELAIQITEELRDLAAFRPGVRTVCLYGGAPIGKQIDTLKKHPQIVVATPGRLSDHMKRRTVRVDTAQTVVLDEADRMLDMGFIHDVTRLLDRMNKRKNLGLFSATISREVMDIAWVYQRDAEEITVRADEQNKPDIKQFRMEVASNEKADAITKILRETGFDRCMAFCNTKGNTERICKFLQMRGVNAECIHGDIPQKRREEVMNRFRQGQIAGLRLHGRGGPGHRRGRRGHRLQLRHPRREPGLRPPHRPHWPGQAPGRGGVPHRGLPLQAAHRRHRGQDPQRDRPRPLQRGGASGGHPVTHRPDPALPGPVFSRRGRFCNQIVTFSARWVYKGRESRYNAIC